MFDLLTSLAQIQTSPAAPFWLRLVIALLLLIPVVTVIFGFLALLSVLRHRRSKTQLARRMGWKWESGGAFSGRLANGASWEGGAYADEQLGAYLNWSGGPLACKTENRIYLAARAEYETQRLARPVEFSAMTGDPRPGVVALMSRVVAGDDASDVALTLSAAARLRTPEKGEAPWVGDSTLQPCPINNRAFEERFVLLSNNRAFALAVFSDAAVAQLLDWDAALSDRFKIRLAWNRLVLQLKPGSSEHLDIEKLGRLALTIAENANASNGAAYWNHLRSNRPAQL